jgi:predicted MFS family arabinose efflux permease
MMVAAFGALVFALAPAAPLLIIGRAMVGFGVAGGLMAGLKANALWVSQRHLPLANGSLVMFGGLGAIAATQPVEMLDLIIGWRGTFLILAVLSMTVAIAILALVPEYPPTDRRHMGATGWVVLSRQ